MSIFDEPVMINGKEVERYKPPDSSNLIDLEKLCPWLRGPTAVSHYSYNIISLDTYS